MKKKPEVVKPLKSYSSCKEMFEEWDKEKKEFLRKNPIGYFLKYNVYYPLCRYYHELSMIPKEIKWFIQRGRRGWSDCDVWGFATYNARVCKEAITWLRKNSHTLCPNSFLKKGKSDKEVSREWNEVLDKMIKTFTFLSDEYTEQYYPSKENPKEHIFQKLHDENPELYKYTYLMTKEDDLAQKEGFKLFMKYYQSLWD